MYTQADGAVYDGSRMEGNKHEQGKMTWCSKTVYTGSWHDDKMHGLGGYTYADGSVYDGSWVEDKEGKDVRVQVCDQALQTQRWPANLDLQPLVF